MTRRWLIIALIVVALGGIAAWIAEKTYWDEVSVPLPLSGEAAKNPFYTAQRFSEALGARTEWRHALGVPPASDAVMVLTNWHWSLIASRRKQLEQWVESGGRLVLDNTMIGRDDELKAWSGLEIVYKSETEEASDDSASADEPKAETDDDDCDQLIATYEAQRSDLRQRYSICRLDPGSWIKSARPIFWALHNKEGIQAARVDIGKGSVTVLNATPFGNRDLLSADHGVLLVAIMQLRRGDHVIFMSEEEHPTLLRLIWDNGKPVVLLVALFIAIALWRGAVRFGPLSAPTEISRRSLAEQIRGTGLFILPLGGSRVLHSAMLRALDEAAPLRIANYSQLTNEQRIAALAQTTGIDTEKLAEAINHRGVRTPHNLQHAVAILESARRALLKPSTSEPPEATHVH